MWASTSLTSFFGFGCGGSLRPPRPSDSLAATACVQHTWFHAYLCSTTPRWRCSVAVIRRAHNVKHSDRIAPILPQTPQTSPVRANPARVLADARVMSVLISAKIPREPGSDVIPANHPFGDRSYQGRLGFDYFAGYFDGGAAVPIDVTAGPG